MKCIGKFDRQRVNNLGTKDQHDEWPSQVSKNKLGYSHIFTPHSYMQFVH